MNAHLEAMAALRASLGCVDRGAVLTASAPANEPSPLVLCTDCTGNVAGRCQRRRAAGLASDHLGQLARMPQNCAAFVARTKRKEPA